MPQIMAGTTGKADAISFSPCVLCRQPGTFDFFETQGINPEGWNASYETEMVTVPNEALPGQYTITVRNTTLRQCMGNPSIITANCKHLSFEVIPPTPPVDGPGCGDQPCP